MNNPVIKYSYSKNNNKDSDVAPYILKQGNKENYKSTDLAISFQILLK